MSFTWSNSNLSSILFYVKNLSPLPLFRSVLSVSWLLPHCDLSFSLGLSLFLRHFFRLTLSIKNSRQLDKRNVNKPNIWYLIEIIRNLIVNRLKEEYSIFLYVYKYYIIFCFNMSVMLILLIFIHGRAFRDTSFSNLPMYCRIIFTRNVLFVCLLKKGERR